METPILKNGSQDNNKPKLYLRNVPGIVFAIVFVTRFYICPESFIPKCFMLDDSRKNHFYGLQPCQMTGIMKWACPRTFDITFKTLSCLLSAKFRPFLCHLDS